MSQTVRAGDPLGISATAWNRAQQAADLVLNNMPAPLPRNPASRPTIFRGAEIKVENHAYAPVPAFGILQLNGLMYPSITPEKLQGNTHASGCEFIGRTPTDDPNGIICITTRAIAEWDVGKAVLLGVTLCQIDVKSEDHLYAKPVPREVGFLESAVAGPVRILEKTDETGKVWAYVLLGGGGATAQNRRGVTQSTFTQNADRTASVRVRLYKSQVPSEGQELGDEVVDAYCLRAKKGEYVDQGKNVILVWVDGHFDMEPEC